MRRMVIGVVCFIIIACSKGGGSNGTTYTPTQDAADFAEHEKALHELLSNNPYDVIEAGCGPLSVEEKMTEYTQGKNYAHNLRRFPTDSVNDEYSIKLFEAGVQFAGTPTEGQLKHVYELYDATMSYAKKNNLATTQLEWIELAEETGWENNERTAKTDNTRLFVKQSDPNFDRTFVTQLFTKGIVKRPSGVFVENAVKEVLQ